MFADTLAIESTAKIKGTLHYNTLRAQGGAQLDVQLVKGLDEDKVKVSSKSQKQKKNKKGQS